jgi:hypothetical protein
MTSITRRPVLDNTETDLFRRIETLEAATIKLITLGELLSSSMKSVQESLGNTWGLLKESTEEWDASVDSINANFDRLKWFSKSLRDKVFEEGSPDAPYFDDEEPHSFIDQKYRYPVVVEDADGTRYELHTIEDESMGILEQGLVGFRFPQQPGLLSQVEVTASALVDKGIMRYEDFDSVLRTTHACRKHASPASTMVKSLLGAGVTLTSNDVDVLKNYVSENFDGYYVHKIRRDTDVSRTLLSILVLIVFFYQDSGIM